MEVQVLLVSRPPKNAFLAHFIAAFWACEANHADEFERVLPSGRVQLFINLDDNALHHYEADGSLRQQASGMAVHGPALAPIVINRGEQRSLCGVLFSPGGAFPYFRTPIPEIGSGLVDLDCLSWHNGQLLRERLQTINELQERLDLLEATFLNRIPDLHNWDVVVREATGLLRQGWRVRNLVDQFETTPQTFIARFRERTGMTPKTYSRIERFQRVVRSKSWASSWADAALDAGFADQPHMVREFKHFGEITPTEYKPHSRSAPNHCPI